MENLSQPTVEKMNKIYAVGNIAGATFLGGPLAGTYMMYKNFKNFGDDDKAQKTLIIGSLYSLTLIAVVLVPFLKNILGDLVPFLPGINLTTALIAASFLQKEAIANHKANSGQFEPIWKSILIAISALVLFVLCAIAFGVFLSLLS